MEDIGMSPDYRSGVCESVECHICKRAMPDHLVDECYECLKPTCKECIDSDLSGWFCVECVAGEAGECPTCDGDDGGDVLPIE